MTTQHFKPLEHTAFQRLDHAAFLKGFLFPFKGKGPFEACSNRHEQLRDSLISLARHELLPQSRTFPLALLPIHFGMQSTGAGTSFLRWRNLDRSAMGVSLWADVIQHPATPAHLIADLYAMELQRIAINMQISLVHLISKQARECAHKAEWAQAIYQQRIHS
ncbi:DUF3158 family protein [Saezia sanguinis]|uniref:DUF3158 family protein n=1 Tax=Saezia sanguinis TaxID=1965230 RepID=UPI0030297B2F